MKIRVVYMQGSVFLEVTNATGHKDMTGPVMLKEAHRLVEFACDLADREGVEIVTIDDRIIESITMKWW